MATDNGGEISDARLMLWCPGADLNHRHGDFQSRFVATNSTPRLQNAPESRHEDSTSYTRFTKRPPPPDGQEKAANPASLAANGLAAEPIGGEASGRYSNTTVAAFRAIGDIARDVVASVESRARIAGTLHPRWRV
jgi:hypothetical protein